jgi:DNA-nicking Smr family endonuclease
MSAKENAFNDIYERMNSTGSMGISLIGQSTTVDLHGQSVEAAKRFINDPILPVLHVLKKIMVITGCGLNSTIGEGVLKPALKSYLSVLNIKCEDVEGKDGAIFILA